MTRAHRLLAPTLATTLLALAPGARADGCPEARDARHGGRAAEAETLARACVMRNTEDVGAWFELSLAIGYQGRHDEALHWVVRGLERYPADTDLGVWRARLLAWSGRLVDAREALDDLLSGTPALLADPETAALDVDLELWSERWDRAIAGYTAFLARWPGDPEALRKRGLAHLRRGDRDLAAADLGESCSLGLAASCAHATATPHEAASVAVRFEPSYVRSSVGDDVHTRLIGTAQVGRGFEVGLGGELRTRFGDGDPLSDTLALLEGGWRGDGLAASLGLGIGPGATFSPRLSAWFEPSVALTEALWARLRYWRVSFADAGAHVLAPSLDLYVGDFNVDLRYFLSLEDGASAPKHAAIARLRWDVGRGFGLEVGGGGGNATDALDRPELGGRHVVAIAGVSWAPSWQHRVGVTGVFRHEAQDDGYWSVRYEALLSYRFAL